MAVVSSRVEFATTKDGITIINGQGTILPIGAMVEEVNIYQSIFSPYVSGNLVISDSRNLLSDFQFLGGERLYLRFSVHYENQKMIANNMPAEVFVYDMEFEIYKVSDRKRVDEGIEVYALHFISREAIADLKTRVSRGFQATPSNIATTIWNEYILDEISSTKSLEIEPTTGIEQCVIPYYRPSEVISWLTQRSISAKYKTSGYLFFEKALSEGSAFHFKSFDKLISESPIGKFKIRFEPFPLDPKNRSENFDTDVSQYRVSDFYYVSLFDEISTSQTGVYANTDLRHDLIYKTYDKIQHSLTDIWDSMFHTQTVSGSNKAQKHIPFFDPNNSFLKSYIQNRSIIQQQTGLFSPDTQYTNIDESKYFHKMRMNSINQYAVRLQISGCARFSIGDKVEFYTPIIQSGTKNADIKDHFDQIWAGEYIVSSVRLHFDKKTIVSHVEIIKDSISAELGNRNYQSSDFIRTVDIPQ